MSDLPLFDQATFDGDTADPELDYPRLRGQARRVFFAMDDGRWRTLWEIQQLTGDPQASISARLRDFRKEDFGEHEVERRRRDDEGGTFEYRLLVNEDWSQEAA